MPYKMSYIGERKELIDEMAAEIITAIGDKLGFELANHKAWQVFGRKWAGMQKDVEMIIRNRLKEYYLINKLDVT